MQTTTHNQDAPAQLHHGVSNALTLSPETVRVPLYGKHGEGHFMTLDEDDWQHAREAWGADWTLMPNGCGKAYVTSCRHSLAHLTDQPGSGDTARLARLLMGAKRGDIVVYQDGDPLNLRRGNLLLLKRGPEAAQWLAAREITRAALH